MAKLSMKAKKEVIKKHQRKYQRSSKKEKGILLDSLCLSTGLSRDRAARLLSGKSHLQTNKQRKKRGREKKYGTDVQVHLRKVWACMGFACGKRVAAGMDDMLDALLRFEEIKCTKEVEQKLRSISASTIDRLLAKDRASMSPRGISTTKPGTLLKKDIPLRLGTQWDDAIPGYVEIDLVAHCGASTSGEYINTLTVTDICTCWTEPIAVINKAQRHVFQGLMEVQERQPFPFRGIDSDNGSEFINAHLYRYCKEENICFTRGRSYKKNDGCHVEQKNWSLVRRNIGYARFEGDNALALLNRYYELLRLHVNFFLPSMKLLSKERTGARIVKIYDHPTTPYKRCLASEHISKSEADRLCALYATLNPAALLREMEKVYNELYKLGMA